MSKILIDEAVVKQTLETLQENHHLIEDHERSEYLAHYDRVIAAVEKALTERSSTWVSVKDSLPPVGEDVLTYSVDYPEDGFDCERYLGGDEWSVKYSVSHWMPLPDAPKAAHGITEGN